MEEIKLSRNQDNVYHTELCSVFFSRKSTSKYMMGQKGTWKRKNKFFKQGKEGSVGASAGRSVLLHLVLMEEQSDVLDI